MFRLFQYSNFSFRLEKFLKTRGLHGIRRQAITQNGAANRRLILLRYTISFLSSRTGIRLTINLTVCISNLGHYCTAKWLDGPGIESRWGTHFPHPSRPALGTTQLPVQYVPGLSWGVMRPGLGVDHPILRRG